MQITSVVTLAKTLTVKREKGEAGDLTLAHLKFCDLFIKREDINWFCGQGDGWAETSFFDELGAPLGKWSLKLHGQEFSASGVLSLPNEAHKLKFAGGVIGNCELQFTSEGAVLHGEITWPVAGDEAGDVEPLLGGMVNFVLDLSGSGQADLLRAA